MINNNQYYQQPFGYNQPPQAQPKMTEVLTPEEIKILTKQSQTNGLAISNVEILEGKCCHRYNGVSVLEHRGGDTFYCPICKHSFHLLENLTQEQVQEITDTAIDLLQTIKTMYVDVPPKVGQEFFQVMALIEKFPFMYKLASDDINRYGGGNYGMNTSGTPDGFGMLYSLTGPGQQYYPPQYNATGYQTPYPGAQGGYVPNPQAGYQTPYPGTGYQAPYAPQGGYDPNAQGGYQVPYPGAQGGYNPNVQAGGYPSYPGGQGAQYDPTANAGQQGQSNNPLVMGATQQQNNEAQNQQNATVTKNASFGV